MGSVWQLARLPVGLQSAVLGSHAVTLFAACAVQLGTLHVVAVAAVRACCAIGGAGSACLMAAMPRGRQHQRVTSLGQLAWVVADMAPMVRHMEVAGDAGKALLPCCSGLVVLVW